MRGGHDVAGDTFYLGDGLNVEFIGLLFRLVCHREENGVNEVFMDHDAIKKFKAFIELIERATHVERRNTQASVSPEARDDLLAYEAARNAAKAGVKK
jgi:hypothetical protein